MQIHRRFPFTWDDDILIPAVSVFGKPNLIPHVEGTLGRTDTHVVLQLGEWTLAFTIDSKSRFPDVIPIIPHANSFTARLELDSRDEEKLRENLLNGSGKGREPRVSLRLGPPVSVIIDSAPRFALRHSRVRGNPLTVTFESTHLVRALDMGFRDFRFTQAPKNIVVCQDRRRLYLWVALESKPMSSPVPHEMANTA